MQKQCAVWWVLVGLGAATGLGGCFFSSDEASPDPRGEGGASTTSDPGPGGDGGGGTYVGGSGGAEAGGPDHGKATPAGSVAVDLFIPSECEHLLGPEEPEHAVVLYLPTPDSNAMASPVHAREQIESSQAPTNIRAHEFLNYYRIHYPAPAPAAGTLAIEAHAAPRNEQAWYDLQIGVRSFEPVLPRGNMAITFVLDTSGSMGPQSINRERAVVEAIAQSLQAGDVVNIVTWDTSDAELLNGHVVNGASDPTLMAAAAALSANGGTDLLGGLAAGYALAEEHHADGWLSRVVLVSDGNSNIGVTDETQIANLSQQAEQQGILLVGVGTGPAERYDDRLMQTVTDMGGGTYVYIDSVAEAANMFVGRFDEVMSVAARAVQVEVLLPWFFEMNEHVGDEVAEAPSQVDPQHLAPGDSMIFHQVLEACSSQLVDDVSSGYQMVVQVTWQRPDDGQAESTTFAVGIHDLLQASNQAPLRKGQAIVAYAEALETGTAVALQAALQKVESAKADGPDDELDEIADLISMHPSFLQR